MFKIHLLATNRMGGKTTWLNTEYDARAYLATNHFNKPLPKVLFIGHTVEATKRAFKDVIGREYNCRAHYASFASMDNAFRGQNDYDAVYIDEYQLLTPEQWHDLKFNLFASNVKDLYLAGDLNHTFNALSMTEVVSLRQKLKDLKDALTSTFNRFF